MPGHTYLYRRGAVYYFRRAVPDDLRDSLGKREIQASLRTKDFAKAKSSCITKALEVDREFALARARQSNNALTPALNALTKEQEDALHAAYHAHLLEDDDQARLDGFFDPEDGTIPDWNGQTFEEYGNSIQEFEEGTRKERAAGKRSTFWTSEAHEVASWDGIDLKLVPESLAEKQAIKALQGAAIVASADIQRRNQGDIIPTPEVIFATPEIQPLGRLLSTLKDEWVAEHMRGDIWRDQTRDKFVSSVDTFIELVGDKPITDYTKSDAARFKSWLMDVAPNWRKKSQLKSLPIGQVAEASRRLELPTLSITTINSNIGTLYSLFGWCEKNVDDIKNIFDGLEIKAKTTKAKDQWAPFTTDELNRIFSAPLFAGCQSERDWKTPGLVHLHTSHLYWAPLIGLHTGARPSEILQLHCDDIGLVLDFPCISINDDEPDKGLKNEASSRILPVHRGLLRLGFLNFVAYQRAQGNQRLFPDATTGGKNKLSSQYSTKFGPFLRSLNITRAKVSFRSFRHNFEDFAILSRIPLEGVQFLQGRSFGGTTGRYGWGENRVKAFKEDIDALYFDGVSLDHLKPFEFDGGIHANLKPLKLAADSDIRARAATSSRMRRDEGN